MLTTAAEYLRSGQHREALGRVLVKLPCEHVFGLGSPDIEICCSEKVRPLNLRSILVTDEAGEVGALCDSWLSSDEEGHPYRIGHRKPVTARLYLWDGSPVDWKAVLGLCPRCGGTGSVEDVGYGHACGGDLERCARVCPVPEQIQVQCDCHGGWLNPEQPLTAVVLVREEWSCDQCDWTGEQSELVSEYRSRCPECGYNGFTTSGVTAARTACASAGVQFVTAGEELRL